MSQVAEAVRAVTVASCMMSCRTALIRTDLDVTIQCQMPVGSASYGGGVHAFWWLQPPTHLNTERSLESSAVDKGSWLSDVVAVVTLA